MGGLAMIVLAVSYVVVLDMAGVGMWRWEWWALWAITSAATSLAKWQGRNR